MLISWNEIRQNAIRFSLESAEEQREEAVMSYPSFGVFPRHRL